jgi:phosphoribosylpyrophosphate synthetase
VLAGEAVEKLTHAPIDTVICTNTIHLKGDKQFAKLHTVSIARLLADAISTLVR